MTNHPDFKTAQEMLDGTPLTDHEIAEINLPKTSNGTFKSKTPKPSQFDRNLKKYASNYGLTMGECND